MERLDLKLASHNCPSLGIAKSIKYSLSHNLFDTKAILYLEKFNISPESNLNKIATTLRRLTITTLRENECAYSLYTMSKKDTFLDEINQLEKSCSYSSEIFNCIPLAICNILKMQIIIFTGMMNIPIIPLNPTEKVTIKQPMYLAYDHQYSYQFYPLCKSINVVHHSLVATNNDTNIKQSCRCGQGAKKRMSNTVSCDSFRAGCPCFRAIQCCGQYCKCIGCKNPYGQQIKSDSPDVPHVPIKRTRRPHQLSTRQIRDEEFYKERETSAQLKEKWSLFEEILLTHLMRLMIEVDDFDINALNDQYQVISSYANENVSGRYLGNKDLSDVTKKFFNVIEQDKAFQIMLKKQVQLNNF